MELPQGHSSIGASGAKRWMACPGSVALSLGIVDPDSDHAAEGTAAHMLAETSLRTGFDAWNYIGMYVVPAQINHLPPGIYDAKSMDYKSNAKAAEKAGIPVTKDMADAVQVYLDWVRKEFKGVNELLIEHRFHCPSIHPDFFGTTDLAAKIKRTLYVTDYKHGVGIVVEAVDNEQGKYYAAGYLETFDAWQDIDEVVITIAQPRAFHRDGPIRSWTITRKDLAAWLEDKLIPAMKKTEVSRDTVSGEHCRFCPARSHACPQLLKDVEEFQIMSEKIMAAEAVKAGTGAKELNGEQLSRYLDLGTQIKIAFKAAQTTAFHRLSNGGKVPGYKLVAGKADRQFKKGAEAAAKKKFGDAAYTEPKLKSPAQIEALPLGEKFTARWAEKPEGALQVVAITDSRTGISKDNKSAFTARPKGGRK